jgi:hypothetical protein
MALKPIALRGKPAPFEVSALERQASGQRSSAPFLLAPAPAFGL